MRGVAVFVSGLVGCLALATVGRAEGEVEDGRAGGGDHDRQAQGRDAGGEVGVRGFPNVLVKA